MNACTQRSKNSRKTSVQRRGNVAPATLPPRCTDVLCQLAFSLTQLQEKKQRSPGPHGNVCKPTRNGQARGPAVIGQGRGDPGCNSGLSGVTAIIHGGQSRWSLTDNPGVLSVPVMASRSDVLIVWWRGTSGYPRLITQVCPPQVVANCLFSTWHGSHNSTRSIS